MKFSNSCQSQGRARLTRPLSPHNHLIIPAIDWPSHFVAYRKKGDEPEQRARRARGRVSACILGTKFWYTYQSPDTPCGRRGNQPPSSLCCISQKWAAMPGEGQYWGHNVNGAVYPGKVGPSFVDRDLAKRVRSRCAQSTDISSSIVDMLHIALESIHIVTGQWILRSRAPMAQSLGRLKPVIRQM